MSSFFASYYFVIIILLNICFAQKHYQFYQIQDYEICVHKSILKTPYKTIKELLIPPEISLNFNKPIIIKQIWNSTIMKKINSNCMFRVKTTSKKFGIYAVITKLKFRKVNMIFSCSNYIEFLYHNKTPIMPKLCGNFDTNESNNTVSLGTNKDDIFIKVVVKDIEIDEPLELELYLTAYGPCDADGFPCNNLTKDSCIYKELLNDNIPNCLRCDDEDTCMVSENIKRKLIETTHIDYSHIIISALTSLIFTMFAVGTIAYTIWKYWHFCHPVRNEATVNDADAPTLELPETQFTGAVTMDYVNQNRPPSPKDLPPSYDELFPDRII